MKLIKTITAYHGGQIITDKAEVMSVKDKGTIKTTVICELIESAVKYWGERDEKLIASIVEQLRDKDNAEIDCFEFFNWDSKKKVGYYVNHDDDYQVKIYVIG